MPEPCFSPNFYEIWYETPSTNPFYQTKVPVLLKWFFTLDLKMKILFSEFEEFYCFYTFHEQKPKTIIKPTQVHTCHIIWQHPANIGSVARQKKIAQIPKNDYLKILLKIFDHFCQFFALFEAFASQEIHTMHVMLTAIA